MKNTFLFICLVFLLCHSTTAYVRFNAFSSAYRGSHATGFAKIAQPMNRVVDKVNAWRSSVRLPFLGRNRNRETGRTASTAKHRRMGRRLVIIAAAALTSLFSPKGHILKAVRASGMMTSDASTSSSNLSPLQGLGVWVMLFTLSATMHSAESAITKISPWKVEEFAEEEGSNSPFSTLSRDMTRLLSTILLTTTVCSIYSTALFVTTFVKIFPNVSLGFVTAFLTAITLFFGELLPKALAVSNSELVARKLVPPINRLSSILLPVTYCINKLSDFCLSLAGMRNVEDRAVSELMLRRVVDEAIASAEGIETAEGRMITSVLDMQDKEVTRTMRPRVEIVAVSVDTNATEILQTAISTKYSRIPVYRGDIDNIVGILFTKDLLEYIETPKYADSSSISGTASNSYDLVVDQLHSNNLGVTNMGGHPKLSPLWKTLTASKLLEKTYYIPETMSCWNALQEMRKRRTHLAVVVDEYGGTSGLVTLEDLLEEVVGEIYDEDDDEEKAIDFRAIFKRADGSFMLKGNAELDDVFEALDIDGSSSGDGNSDYSLVMKNTIGEYTTIGGLLCSVAGMIPQAGALIPFAGFIFTVLEVEEKRRIQKLVAVRVQSVGSGPSTENGSKSLDGNSGNGAAEEGVEALAEASIYESFDNSDAESPGDSGSAAVSNSKSVSYGDTGLSDKVLSENSIKSGDSVAMDHSTVVAVGDDEQEGEDILIFRDGEWFQPDGELFVPKDAESDEEGHEGDAK